MAALRAGLADCRALLAPPPLGMGGGTTLALSTARSEALKGVVTRAGSRITRSDMRIKMAGLPPGFRLALAGPHSDGQQQRQQPQPQPQPQPQQQHQPPPQLVLEQLVDAGNHVAAALEILHGDGAFPPPSDDARAVLDALGALMGHVAAARTALKGAAVHRLFPYHAADPRVRLLCPYSVTLVTPVWPRLAPCGPVWPTTEAVRRPSTHRYPHRWPWTCTSRRRPW